MYRINSILVKFPFSCTEADNFLGSVMFCAFPERCNRKWEGNSAFNSDKFSLLRLPGSGQIHINT